MKLEYCRGEFLVLCGAVIKKHTLDSKRAFKFHLAQPARLLAKIVAFCHMRMLRKMKQKTRASQPWMSISHEIYHWRCLIVSRLSL